MKEFLGVIMSLIMSLSGGGYTGDVPEDSQFEVRFIDVGQADCALIKCDDETMLIDGGNREDSSLVVSVLKNNNVEYLDYVVCTHAHEDHVGGLSGALSFADAGHILAPETEADTKVYQNFVEKAKERGVKIEHPDDGDNFMLGSAQVEILGPVNEKGKDINSTSIVLRIDYGETSFLFTGDAESDEEGDIIENSGNLKATVLKVGHHGSDTSTSYQFLREVMPMYSVISVGKDNSYGHPDESIISRLEDSGTKILRTDECGDIIMTSDGKNIDVNTSK